MQGKKKTLQIKQICYEKFLTKYSIGDVLPCVTAIKCSFNMYVFLISVYMVDDPLKSQWNANLIRSKSHLTHLTLSAHPSVSVH